MAPGSYSTPPRGRHRNKSYDHSDGEACHDLCLFRAGAAGRASDDAAPARQQRSAAARSHPRYRAAAVAAALDSRPVRQLRRGRRVLRRHGEPSRGEPISRSNIRLSRSPRPCWRIAPGSIRSPTIRTNCPTSRTRCERHHPDPDGELDRWARQFLIPGGPTETGALLMTLTYAIKEGISSMNGGRRRERRARGRRWSLGAAPAAISRR